jgi:hypothetical protein
VLGGSRVSSGVKCQCSDWLDCMWLLQQAIRGRNNTNYMTDSATTPTAPVLLRSFGYRRLGQVVAVLSGTESLYWVQLTNAMKHLDLVRKGNQAQADRNNWDILARLLSCFLTGDYLTASNIVTCDFLFSYALIYS